MAAWLLRNAPDIFYAWTAEGRAGADLGCCGEAGQRRPVSSVTSCCVAGWRVRALLLLRASRCALFSAVHLSPGSTCTRLSFAGTSWSFLYRYGRRPRAEQAHISACLSGLRSLSIPHRCPAGSLFVSYAFHYFEQTSTGWRCESDAYAQPGWAAALLRGHCRRLAQPAWRGWLPAGRGEHARRWRTLASASGAFPSLQRCAHRALAALLSTLYAGAARRRCIISRTLGGTLCRITLDVGTCQPVLTPHNAHLPRSWVKKRRRS